MRPVSPLALALAATLALGSRLPAQSTWTLDPKPILDIAGALPGGAVNFALPAGATRLSDGSLLIADRGGLSIQLFDPAGKLLKTAGRNGEGPGEFQTMAWAGACGRDSMLVWDPRLHRASVVGKSGAVARQFTIAADVPRALWFSCGTGGAIAYLSEPTGRQASTIPNVMLMQANVVTVGRDGALVKNHGQISGGEWFAPGRGAFPRPLGMTTSIAMVSESLVIGIGDSASVLVIAPDGKRTTLPIPAQRRPPTQEEFDAAVQTIGSMAPGALRQTAIDALSKAPLPQLLPPYAAVLADAAGLFWVQLSPSGAKQVDFLAMRLDGRVVARVRLPRGLSIYEVGRDFVLGSYNDSGDEVHVAVYRLKR